MTRWLHQPLKVLSGFFTAYLFPLLPKLLILYIHHYYFKLPQHVILILILKNFIRYLYLLNKLKLKIFPYPNLICFQNSLSPSLSHHENLDSISVKTCELEFRTQRPETPFLPTTQRILLFAICFSNSHSSKYSFSF